MAGKKQHFIPQALLRGFSSNGKQVYQYRGGASQPFKNNITNVAAKRFFYGEEDCEVDTKITDFENLNASVLSELRVGSIPNARDELIKLVYTHLLRTWNFRKTIDLFANELMGDFVNIFSAQDLITIAKDRIINDPEYLMQEVRKGLARRGIVGTPEKEEFVKKFFIENLDSLLLKINAEAGLEGLLEHLNGLDFSIAEGVQRRLLPEIVDNSLQHGNPIVDRLSKLSWVVRAFEENIVLGDSIVVAGVTKDDFSISIDRLDRINFIYMPVSSSSVLFGTRAGNEDITADEFNKMSVSISQDFFVSGIEVDHSLIEYFGCRAGGEMKFDMEIFKNEILANYNQ